MSDVRYKANASTVDATLVSRSDSGGFLAVASDDTLDRDGEVLQFGCFEPLPASLPVHLDHVLSASAVIGRGRPYYEGRRLLIDVTFASTDDAQQARKKVSDGVLTDLSVVFVNGVRKSIDGVPTVTQGELVACDLVSIPSNRNARVLSSRSAPHPLLAAARQAADSAHLKLAEISIAHARRDLKRTDPHPHRSQVERLLRSL